MKNYFLFIAFLVFFIVSCDSGKKTESDSDVSALNDETADQDEIEDLEDTETEDSQDSDESETDDDTADEITGPVSCETAEDCMKYERSSGFLCVDSKCIPCETDGHCQADSLFGEYGDCEKGRCSVSPGCLEAGCEEGKLCDESTRVCRDKYKCENNICYENQVCQVESTGTDDICLEECLAGFSWDKTSKSCKSVSMNCQQGKENSRYEECLAEFKVCVENDDSIYCGECIDGYRAVSGNCVKKLNCSDLSCADGKRLCVESTDDDDAYCSRCFSGYLESVLVLNSDFNESNTEALSWTIFTRSDSGFRTSTEEIWDFSNYVLLHPDGSLNCGSSDAAYIEQSFESAISGVEKRLSVRFASGSESGLLDDDVIVKIKLINDSGEEEELYSNKISSFEGVVEKSFDIASIPEIKKIRVEAHCGGLNTWNNEYLAVDWIRIYSRTSNTGICAKMIGTNCNSDDSERSILNTCEAEHRGCRMVDEKSAECTECEAGYVDVNGICEKIITCEMLICEKDHKECEDKPNGHCTDCFEGFEKNIVTGECSCPSGKILNYETGACESLIKCSDITCLEDEFCLKETLSTHALCSRCEEGFAWDNHKSKCVQCPLCVGTGETGRVFPFISLQGHCVCETERGYFHSSSAPIGTRKCDADGDGWVTEEAKSAINASDDTAEKLNARCDVRYIDRMILQNELNERKIVRISDIPGENLTRVPLYEPKNRDVETFLVDDAVFGGTTINYAPKYGESGVLFTASDLNPMTKACSSANENSYMADYNANGIYDIDETGWKTTEGKDSFQKIYTRFSYYTELHRGWFEKDKNSKYGGFVIAEKSRSEFAPEDNSVPLNYGSKNESKYWRKCMRWQDADYSDSPGVFPYGLDFANYSEKEKCNPGNEGSWCGMHHHSQFKCVRILKDSESLDPEYPHHIKAGDITDKWLVNKCDSELISFKPVTPGVKNPSDRKITCADYLDPEESPVIWLNVEYETVVNADLYEYKRGCISECNDENTPFYLKCSGEASCRDDISAGYGKIYCYKPLETSAIYTNNTFSMGTPADKGIYDEGGLDEFLWKGADENYHDVTITYFYEIAKTETTMDQFKETMGYNSSRYDCQNAVCPVENVSFYDALAFANKYSVNSGKNKCYKLTSIVCADGRDDETDYCSGQGGIQSATVILNGISKVQDCQGYRLPTEAEWEYAAGSGYEQPNYDDRPFFLGDITVFDCGLDPVLDTIGWYCGNSETESQIRTHPVAMKRASDWGVFDLNGNVAEWVWDSYTETLEISTDPAYSGSNDRVVRGGSFQSASQECRSSSRYFMPASQRSKSVGFRIVKTMF
jgi:formylglycine-generating enzyme required for sulfatase activity